MKQIALTQNKFAIVDDKDFEELNQFKWYAQKGNSTFYAVRSVYNNGGQTLIKMHRQILGLTDIKIHCDHKDHNGLDNQKSNLRECSNIENQRNRKSQIGSSSKFKGIYFNKLTGKWLGQIMVGKERIYLGLFTDEFEAAEAYDNAAKEHFGEFANLNFKELKRIHLKCD